MLKIFLMIVLNLKFGWFYFWVLFFFIRFLDFYFWWLCLIIILNIFLGYSLVNLVIFEKINLIYNYVKICKELVFKMLFYM